MGTRLTMEPCFRLSLTMMRLQSRLVVGQLLPLGVTFSRVGSKSGELTASARQAVFVAAAEWVQSQLIFGRGQPQRSRSKPTTTLLTP
jgi:hypothetical protein